MGQFTGLGVGWGEPFVQESGRRSKWDTFELTSRTTDDATWVGQFFAYGGSGAAESTAI